MNEDSVYAFYGSLRRGMKLYTTFKSALEYQYSFWLHGYHLFALTDYPCAVKSSSPTNKILIEVMKINDTDVAKEIFEIEIAAGYFYEDIKIKNTPVGIFLFESGANYKRVEHGDWVKFFGDRLK
ncbi:MAG: gamma-glutamylcyclotransferase [Cyclobacteriaceae bacterium]|nr:gamma-glutamylcyclotransferase [Cyclobacteriaceae bacterium]